MKKFSRVCLLVAALPLLAAHASAQDFELDFDRGVDGWRTVVDGVMGGLSTGRVTAPQPGVLRFSGDLSLENNGGFSQARVAVDGKRFEGSTGVEIEVRGDGRTYNFDLRVSNVRTMAGAYQQAFETTDGQWSTIRLPLEDFKLYSFGRLVRGAPAITPTTIESIGVSLSDKNPGSFRLDIRSIRAVGADTQSQSQSLTNDLASVARAGGLTTLLDLVTTAGLELPDESVTIFAPTNEAFEALPEELVDTLRSAEGADMLRSILAYHVTTPALASSQLLSRRSVGTVNGQPIEIGREGPLSIGPATLVASDIAFDSGVVHVIDRVLVPELEPITTIASNATALSTLVAAVDAAGLLEQLGPENGPWTVFAPLDSAFAALPEGALDDLLQPENRQRLVGVLGLHVVPGRLASTDLLKAGRARTLLGPVIEFGVEDGGLRVGKARIVKSDIQASNGVVHLIDAVLLPRESGFVGDDGGAARMRAAGLIELAINRGAPLFNAGQYAGCASVYEVATESLIGFGRRSLEPAVLRRFEQGAAEADTEDAWFDKAWAYRRAFDDVLPMLLRDRAATNAALR